MKIVHFIYPLICFLLISCATHRELLSAPLIPANTDGKSYVLLDSISIKAKNASTSSLEKNTRWIRVGSIPQGDVFRSPDQVVIVNSFNVFEGNIVVKDDYIIGYYLPTEHAFVESQAVKINFKEKEDAHEN